MSRTVPSFAEEGLKRFLHGMDRRIKDLERGGNWRFDDEELDEGDSVAGFFPRTILDYGAPDWRYNVIDRADSTDYSAQAFDDSAWLVGTATFGATTGTSLRPITTTTAMESRIWLRRTLPGGLASVTVTVMADNDGEAWWNGAYLGSFTLGGGNVSSDEHQFNVPPSALDDTSNVLAVRVTDDVAQPFADHHYADARVVAVTHGIALDDLTDVDTTVLPPSDGDSLVYDSSAGLWVPGTVGPGGGGGALSLISESVLAVDSADVDFTSIASTYRDLELVVTGRGATSAGNVAVHVQFNGDTGNNYDYQRRWALSTTQTTAFSSGQPRIYVGELPAASATAGWAGSCRAEIINYRRTTFHKTVLARSGHRLSSSTLVDDTFGIWKNTAAIDRVRVFPVSGNFLAGTVVSLYGRG